MTVVNRPRNEAATARLAALPEYKRQIAKRLIEEYWDVYRALVVQPLHGEDANADMYADDPGALDGRTGSLSPIPWSKEFSREAAESDREFVAAIRESLDSKVRPLVRDNLPIVLRSIVATLYSEFEALVARLIEGYFRTIAASDNAGSERAEDAMRGGFNAWRQWFQRELGIDWTECAIDWDELVEITQRRHIGIHNEGRVSRGYLKKVAPRYQVPVNTRLVVDQGYVRTALVDFRVAGLLIAFNTSHRLPGASERFIGGGFQDAIYALMKAGEWVGGEKLAAAALRDLSGMNESTRLAIQVNLWLCKKRLGTLDDEYTVVEGWDTSALPRAYSLMKAILMGNLGAATRMALDALDSGEILMDDLTGSNTRIWLQAAAR